MYSDVLGNASEFKDQSLVKPGSPMGGGVIDNRSNDKTLATLISKNSQTSCWI